MINLATFNIFWYPAHDDAQNHRDDTDDRRIVDVLTSLDAHALTFQEILDLDRLEKLLKRVPGHVYQLHQAPPDKAWLTSGSATSAFYQKIVCAYDETVLDLVAASTLPPKDSNSKYPGPRRPFAMHLRDRETGWEFTLVGVHLKSSYPGAPPGDPDADKRKDEAAFLANWLGQPPDLESDDFGQPPTKDVVLLGDLNAVKDDFSVVPLQGASLVWPQAQGVISLDSPTANVPLSDTKCWSTFLDGLVIDHAVVSAGVAPRVRSTLIYAFDMDPALDEAPPAAEHWLHRRTGYWVMQTQGDVLREVPNLYRISDHRPLRVTLDDM